MATSKQLYRSINNRQLAGVCGGIAEYFDIDPTMVRLAWIVITVVTGVVPGVLGYLIAAIVIPRDVTAGNTGAADDSARHSPA